jgi:methylthioribose-1-phosphate isomerase
MPGPERRIRNGPGVIYAWKKVDPCFADETRPLLQGSRLTSWELVQAKIPVTVITDSMAGWLMKKGEISVVLVGADRIARNGDTANKIGTYSLAALAKWHGVPFYVAAPTSTFRSVFAVGKRYSYRTKRWQRDYHLGKTDCSSRSKILQSHRRYPHSLIHVITEKGIICFKREL